MFSSQKATATATNKRATSAGSTSTTCLWCRELIVEVLLKEDKVAHDGRLQGAIVFNILSPRRPVMVYDLKVSVKGTQKQVIKPTYDEQCLFDAPALIKREIDGMMLAAGETHSYPFDYQLPEKLPGSLTADNSSTGGLFLVEYWLEVRLCYRQGGAITWDELIRKPFVVLDAPVALTKQVKKGRREGETAPPSILVIRSAVLCFPAAGDANGDVAYAPLTALQHGGDHSLRPRGCI